MVSLRGLLLFTTVTALMAATFFPGADFSHVRCDSLLTSENPSIGNSFQDTVVDRFRINSGDGFLLMPVTLQGKRYKFVLDTGASKGTYDTSLRALLGDPIKTQRVRILGKPDGLVPVYRVPECSVGKIAIPKELDCFRMDLDGIREASGLEIKGVLGMDFLKNHILRIDLDQEEVTFLQQIGPDPGHKLPIIFEGNLPYVMVKIEGSPGKSRFLVDTGYVGLSIGSLQAETFVELAKQRMIRVQTIDSESVTLSGSGVERSGYVRSISVDVFRHKQLLFNEWKKNILGLGYWSRYVVTLDFPNSVIYLKKGKQFDRRDLSNNTSGLCVRRRKGHTVVVSVLEGSAADHAGIKLNDVLLKVDKMSASEMPLFRIGRMFCEKDKKYHLLVRRGVQELDLTISLPP